MPRTKRPVRKQEQAPEHVEALTKIDKAVTEWKKKFDAKALVEIKNIEISFRIYLGAISVSDLNKTVGQLKATPTKQSTARHSSRAVSHDDAPPTTSRTGGRRSRSADASARSIKTTSSSRATTHRRRSRSVYKTPAAPAHPAHPAYPASVYKTPAYNKNAPLQYPAITPKVAPNTALALLRQPRQGEMVFSMSGSPLMASTYNTMKPNEKAHCNIVLQDGTMLSLQPQQLRPSEHSIPFSLMDNTVLNQLKTLKDNLDKVVKLGEKVID
ncbi:borealin isoform X2 [Bicyclus anynana]|uniref:Borealin isoform X2 n=1 Tax=Bicyclus anynana TaxID=110368 RepID=A0ABM3M2I1_BICAN|nr:borealin isoform X2 [Bicyclus anynana]